MGGQRGDRDLRLILLAETPAIAARQKAGNMVNPAESEIWLPSVWVAVLLPYLLYMQKKVRQYYK